MTQARPPEAWIRATAAAAWGRARGSCVYPEAWLTSAAAAPSATTGASTHQRAIAAAIRYAHAGTRKMKKRGYRKAGRRTSHRTRTTAASTASDDHNHSCLRSSQTPRPALDSHKPSGSSTGTPSRKKPVSLGTAGLDIWGREAGSATHA